MIVGFGWLGTSIFDGKQHDLFIIPLAFGWCMKKSRAGDGQAIEACFRWYTTCEDGTEDCDNSTGLQLHHNMLEGLKLHLLHGMLLQTTSNASLPLRDDQDHYWHTVGIVRRPWPTSSPSLAPHDALTREQCTIDITCGVKRGLASLSEAKMVRVLISKIQKSSRSSKSLPSSLCSSYLPDQARVIMKTR